MVDGIWMMIDVIQFFIRSCQKSQEVVILKEPALPSGLRLKNLLKRP